MLLEAQCDDPVDEVGAGLWRLDADPRSLALHELKEEPAAGDNPVAALYPACYVVILAVAVTERNAPAGETAVRKRDVDERKILIVAEDRRNRNEEAGADVSGLIDTSTYICFLRRSPGLAATMRATTARVVGSTELAMY